MDMDRQWVTMNDHGNKSGNRVTKRMKIRMRIMHHVWWMMTNIKNVWACKWKSMDSADGYAATSRTYQIPSFMADICPLPARKSCWVWGNAHCQQQGCDPSGFFLKRSAPPHAKQNHPFLPILVTYCIIIPSCMGAILTRSFTRSGWVRHQSKPSWDICTHRCQGILLTSTNNP